MYTIKHAAELTGVPVATLRAWERRYGLVAPARTESGYRLYDEQALRTISAMHDLVGVGWAPRQAAEETRRRMSAGGQVTALPETGVPVGESDDGLVAAAVALDPALVGEVLDERFSRGSFEAVVDGWLMPALDRLGRAWADGRISVAGEHLVAVAVQRRLAVAYEASARSGTGAHVVVGSPPGGHHELGLLAFATAARRVGLSVTYVGSDLPAEDWTAVVRREAAPFAVLSLSRRQDLRGVVAVVTALRQVDPEVTVAVGGRYQHLAPEGVRQLGHDIGAAARELADLAGGSRSEE